MHRQGISAVFTLLTIYWGGKLEEAGQGEEGHLFSLYSSVRLYFYKRKQCKKNKLERKMAN